MQLIYRSDGQEVKEEEKSRTGKDMKQFKRRKKKIKGDNEICKLPVCKNSTFPTIEISLAAKL